MNSAIRCTNRDQFGHRCTRKVGHERIHPTPERPKDVRNHTAFGRQWEPVDPLVVAKPKAKGKARAKKRHPEAVTA